MIEKLFADLQRDEGFSEKPYRDSEDFLTIGYGFLIDERKPVSLPKPVASYWLEYVAEARWFEVMDAIPWIVDEPEDVQRAVGNMAYQLGVRGLLKFARMLEALKLGDREEAAREALDSTWAKQTPQRAERIAKLIRGY